MLAGVVIVQFLLFPVSQAVFATNRAPMPLPPRTPSEVGLSYEDVTLSTADGVRLAAWYVPSRNGAAIVLLHGSGSTRASVLDHAAAIASHGFGVLLLDACPHGPVPELGQGQLTRSCGRGRIRLHEPATDSAAR